MMKDHMHFECGNRLPVPMTRAVILFKIPRNSLYGTKISSKGSEMVRGAYSKKNEVLHDHIYYDGAFLMKSAHSKYKMAAQNQDGGKNVLVLFFHHYLLSNTNKISYHMLRYKPY